LSKFSIARAALLAHKIEKSLWENKINTRGEAFDVNIIIANSGLSG